MNGDVGVVPTSAPIRIFIVDPQPLIAAALYHLFSAQALFEVVGTAQSVVARRLATTRPEIVLLGLEHGSTDIRGLVSVCAKAAAAANVCVIACHPHPEFAARFIEAGARGYAVKDILPSELISALAQIHAGSTYVDARVHVDPARAGLSRLEWAHDELSRRETQVLKLIADGYSNREISIALSLSEKTVKNHISRIFAKLRVTARTQAVIHAIKSGLV